ncbi:MAG: phosphoribosylglycinamide formyltransferase [Gemmatimonadales bacterium]|nr:MAG: phosphoribosylglycinamide formyltransferase [Gemmatimonadales bacterium]
MSPSTVFLDRDGTLIQDTGYVGKISDAVLLQGAGEAVRKLNDAGIRVIVVTNQSGIGRGFFSEDDCWAVQAEITEQLKVFGAHVDATYFCPHDPTVNHCECRKPGLALYRRAEQEQGVEAVGAWFVGDRVRDVEPAGILEGHGLLVAGRDGTFDHPMPASCKRVESLSQAVDHILDGERRHSDPLGLAVLVSGSGSNLQALIDRFCDPAIDASTEIRVVIASRPGIEALDRAEAAGIRTVVLPTDAPAAEALLATELEASGVGLVVLAGYLRLIPRSVVAAWRGRMLNLHPALLPAFGGLGMYGRRVHEAVLESGVRTTGVTVHLVDEAYDQGPVVAQWRVPVHEDDDVDSLASRVLSVEHQILPAVVAAVANGTCGLAADGAHWTVPFVPGETCERE